MNRPAAAAGLRRRLLATAGALAVLSGAGLAWRARGPATRVGDDFWALRWPTPDGGVLEASSLRGQRLLVNFWATWCPPCVHELPLLARFHLEQQAQGWRVLALAVDQADAVRRFMERTPVPFPVAVLGHSGLDLARKFGNVTGGLPFSLVFDAKGDLAKQKLGQLRAADLVGWTEEVSSN